MKKSELIKLIREEITDIQNERNTEFDELASKLIGMAAAGTINNNDIDQLVNDMKSARRKMFAARKSPEQRAASAAKAVQTKKTRKIKEEAENLAMKALGITDTSTQLALMWGMHRDKQLQAKYDAKLDQIFNDLVAKGA